MLRGSLAGGRGIAPHSNRMQRTGGAGMQLRSESIRNWWPTTQSLDLVEGPVEAVAAGVETEVKRFLKGEAVATSWESFPSLDATLQAAPEFANEPTFCLVLPSRSRLHSSSRVSVHEAGGLNGYSRSTAGKP